MSHTNTTANYNLPQFVGTDKPAWLTDINGAFNSIDTAIKSAKDTAETAIGNATIANTSIGTLSNLNTTEKTNLVGAINEVNTNVGIAQNTANGASLTATTTANDLSAFIKKFNLNNITNGSPTTQGNVDTNLYTLAQNNDGSIFKFYGQKRFYSSSVIKKQAIAGLTGYYGSPTGLYLATAPTTAYYVKCAGHVFFVRNDETAIKKVYDCGFAVGTDGQIYIWAGTYNGNEVVPADTYLQIQFEPCIYFNSDFGDTPE